MKRFFVIMGLAGLMGSVAGAADFDSWWPVIQEHIENGGTNFVVGGVTTNGTGIISNTAPNEWTFWFPVAGTITVYQADTTFTNTVNVGGGILTMSGSQQSGNNVISLDYDDLVAVGLLSVDGVPQDSLVFDTLGDNIRLKTFTSGFDIRNYADDEYRDLRCRNLTVSGTNSIVNLETINLSTNVIWLNYGHTGAPSQSAWIKVERGAELDGWFGWNESFDTWYAGTESNLSEIMTAAWATNEFVGTNEYKTHTNDFANHTNDTVLHTNTIYSAGTGIDLTGTTFSASNVPLPSVDVTNSWASGRPSFGSDDGVSFGWIATGSGGGGGAGVSNQFLAFTSTNQSLSAGVNRLYTPDIEVFDTGSAFSGSTYTCPNDGYFVYNLGITYETQAGFAPALYTNGVRYQVGQPLYSATTRGATSVVIGPIYQTNGTTVTMYYEDLISDGSPTALEGVTNNWFGGWQQ